MKRVNCTVDNVWRKVNERCCACKSDRDLPIKPYCPLKHNFWSFHRLITDFAFVHSSFLFLASWLISIGLMANFAGLLANLYWPLG